MLGRNMAMVAILVGVVGCGGSESSHTVTGRIPVASEVSDRSTGRTEDPTTIIEIAPGSDPSGPLDVEAAFGELIERRIQCGREPWSCDLSELTVEGSPTHQRFDELFTTRRSAGIVASSDGEFRYRIDDVRTLSSTEAQVTTCITDDTVLVDANGWVFDDGLFSGKVQFDMINTTVGWRWSNDRVLAFTYGEDQCGLLD